ncbi:MAG TPA: hypothetical protein VE439_10390 [Anaerolineae bacterium]|nr:hypothetical protein [Anaerolineae bacterium]
MANSRSTITKKPYAKALVFGIFSIASYVAVLTNEVTVREVWAKGGIYTILPIATVFFFSFVHGNFASYVFSVLGIEAKKH